MQNSLQFSEADSESLRFSCEGKENVFTLSPSPGHAPNRLRMANVFPGLESLSSSSVLFKYFAASFLECFKGFYKKVVFQRFSVFPIFSLTM